jgi:CheY-like chemotaxis protein
VKKRTEDTMTEKNNHRILVIDDIDEIHQDFRKILLTSEPSGSQQYLKTMNAKYFGKDKSYEKIILPPFEIDSAFQGQEGVLRVKKAMENKKPYAVAFVDVQMPPGDDGVETIIKMWEIDPNIQTVICTAYAKYDWDDLMRIFGDTDRLFILKKPFDKIEVIQLASSLTKKWNMNQEVNEQLLKLQKQANLPPEKKIPTKESESSWDSLKKASEALAEFNRKLQEKKINPPNE